MFKVFVLEQMWQKVAEYDELDSAFEMRDHYRKDGYTCEVVMRVKEVYHVVKDNGDVDRLVDYPYPPTAA